MFFFQWEFIFVRKFNKLNNPKLSVWKLTQCSESQEIWYDDCTFSFPNNLRKRKEIYIFFVTLFTSTIPAIYCSSCHFFCDHKTWAFWMNFHPRKEYFFPGKRMYYLICSDSIKFHKNKSFFNRKTNMIVHIGVDIYETNFLKFSVKIE